MECWTNLFVLAICLVIVESRLVLKPGAFLKLPDGAGNFKFNLGTANKATYDPKEKFLYVSGHSMDIFHVINMTDPLNPTVLQTRLFDKLHDGVPNRIAACRKSDGDGWLAVSFESPTRLTRGHVHFYHLLNETTAHDALRQRMDTVATESYDPHPIAWNKECGELIVASEGDPHEINKQFEDPVADIEVLIPGFGTTVGRRDHPISESKVKAAGIRRVFEQCDSGVSSNLTSSIVQDLEPKDVHVDENNIAYIVFQENNAIATLNLSNAFASLDFYDLKMKDWSQYQLDTSYEDSGINLQPRILKSFYQPVKLSSFTMNGKVYLVTADTGSVRRYNLGSCKFDESTIASRWRQEFADGLTIDQQTKLKADMADNKQLGRILVSKMKTVSDGWDNLYQSYDYVTTFGGRGFSILDTSNGMDRVFDSGDDFERYFTSSDATDAEKAIFNAEQGSSTSAQSAGFDKRSIYFGPEPHAIAAGRFDNETVAVIVANGVAGGLYVYNVSDSMGPESAQLDSFFRRGQAGLPWATAYAEDNDAVGEPRTRDLVFIKDQGQISVVAISMAAGAASFYTLVEE